MLFIDPFLPTTTPSCSGLEIFLNLNVSYTECGLFTGKATISNDGATILKTLDIVHPAAKTLVDIAKSQDAEVQGFF